VDFDRFTAESNGELHRLTHKECAVLKLLLERAGRAVTRDEILTRAWAPEEFPTERTVDNFILRLRRLVEHDPTNPATILSIRGVGYQLGIPA
jgi:DNA-binding response OmpR family regulator